MNKTEEVPEKIKDEEKEVKIVLTQEQAKNCLALLNRVNNQGVQEAMVLIDLVRTLNK